VRYRNLGRSGLQVSEVSLGSWLTFGSGVDRGATREIVHRAFDLGINFFDTADA
jgi:aryl-alcohol dehydrogenase-like predicted oxidoreductase